MTENRDWSPLKREPPEELRDQIEEYRLRGGIAAWSNELVKSTGQSWDQVYGGPDGLLEIAIIRNAITHGHKRCGPRMISLFQTVSIECPFDEGEEIQISFERLHTYRGRIRSFCRVIGDGVVHMARGTHRGLKF